MGTSQVIWGALAWVSSRLLLKISKKLSCARRERQQIDAVMTLLLKWEASLLAGWTLDSVEYQTALRLPVPWGRWMVDSIQELRKEGAPLLPTLQRLRLCAKFCQNARRQAEARSAQSVLQASFGLALVPTLGVVWPIWMPGLSGKAEWQIAVILSFGWALGAWFWIKAQVDRACWGGLREGQREWMILAPLAGERLLSAIRSGQSLDVAWMRAIDIFPEWKKSIWELNSDFSPDVVPRTRGMDGASDLANALVRAGERLSRVIQWSMWEGRPAREWIENEMETLQKEIQYFLKKETELLSTRTLFPLLFGVVPPVLVLLGGSLWMMIERG